MSLNKAMSDIQNAHATFVEDQWETATIVQYALLKADIALAAAAEGETGLFTQMIESLGRTLHQTMLGDAEQWFLGLVSSDQAAFSQIAAAMAKMPVEGEFGRIVDAEIESRRLQLEKSSRAPSYKTTMPELQRIIEFRKAASPPRNTGP